MTPAAFLLDELTRRGATVRVLPGDALEIRPRRALDDRLRAQLIARKAEVVALLRGQATPPPDPTAPPPACSSCGGVVFWRPDGDRCLRCATCAPCPSPSTSSWYTSPAPAGDPLAALDDVLGPDLHTAADWAATTGRADLAGELRAALHAADAAAEGDDAEALRAAVRRVVAAAAALRAAFWSHDAEGEPASA